MSYLFKLFPIPVQTDPFSRYKSLMRQKISSRSLKSSERGPIVKSGSHLQLTATSLECSNSFSMTSDSVAQGETTNQKPFKSLGIALHVKVQTDPKHNLLPHGMDLAKNYLQQLEKTIDLLHKVKTQPEVSLTTIELEILTQLFPDIAELSEKIATFKQFDKIHVSKLTIQDFGGCEQLHLVNYVLFPALKDVSKTYFNYGHSIETDIVLHSMHDLVNYMKAAGSSIDGELSYFTNRLPGKTTVRVNPTIKQAFDDYLKHYETRLTDIFSISGNNGDITYEDIKETLQEIRTFISSTVQGDESIPVNSIQYHERHIESLHGVELTEHKKVLETGVPLGAISDNGTHVQTIGPILSVVDPSNASIHDISSIVDSLHTVATLTHAHLDHCAEFSNLIQDILHNRLSDVYVPYMKHPNMRRQILTQLIPVQPISDEQIQKGISPKICIQEIIPIQPEDITALMQTPIGNTPSSLVQTCLEVRESLGQPISPQGEGSLEDLLTNPRPKLVITHDQHALRMGKFATLFVSRAHEKVRHFIECAQYLTFIRTEEARLSVTMNLGDMNPNPDISDTPLEDLYSEVANKLLMVCLMSLKISGELPKNIHAFIDYGHFFEGQNISTALKTEFRQHVIRHLSSLLTDLPDPFINKSELMSMMQDPHGPVSLNLEHIKRSEGCCL